VSMRLQTSRPTAYDAVATGWRAMKASRITVARRATITALSVVAITTAGASAGVGVAGAAPRTHDTTSAQQNTRGASQSADHSRSHADHSKGNAGTSGDSTQPQPPSNADKNPGGANGDQCTTDPKGTYCSTRDGSASGNGNGNGKATGKPCAGCVGKADNKNPPGQETSDPMGTFPNNGYECDRNHGIGRTNPAHTGCTPTTTPECDESTESCGPTECDEATENCGPTECDEATENCGGVLGNHHTRKPPTVEGERVVRTPRAPSALPFTGAALDRVVPLGIASLMLGGLCIAIGRRRRAS